VTVSSLAATIFTRDQILTAAIRKVGILETSKGPTAAQLAIAAVHLELILESLQADDVNLGTVERATPIAMVSGTSEYTMPSDTLDIQIGQSNDIGTIVSTDGSERVVKAMSRSEWLTIAVKTQSGTPTMAYLEKGASCKLVFWPVPDDSTQTFRYTKVRLFKSSGTGANTMDTRAFWSQYLVCAVAAEVAQDNSLYDRAQFCEAQAEKWRERANQAEVQHGKLRWKVGHRGRNW
jgi:hypothetical protein